MTPRGRSHGVAALLLMVLPLLGCGSSPQKKVELAEQKVRSWEATVRLTSETLAAGAVPREYARQVLEAANKARQQQAKQPEWRAVPAQGRSGLDVALRQLESAVERQGGS
jgi:hypothetical protein